MGDNEAFAPSDPERKLFVAALRAYSDNCDSPELTPACPFYELSNGRPACGEQCRDVLAEHDHLAPRTDGFDLGDGIVAYARSRRKARRGPEPSARPFDAAALRLRDKDRPTDVKNTVSLLCELKEIADSPLRSSDDIEERIYLAGAHVDELVSRGFNRAELLMGTAIMVTICQTLTMAVSAILQQDHNIQVNENLSPEWQVVRDEWTRLGSERAKTGYIQGFLGAQLPELLLGWNSSLSIEELAAWKSPDPSIVRDTPSGYSAELRDKGLWIFDRFTVTYLHEWHMSSLELEWAYLHSDLRGCCVSDQMKLRRTNEHEVARLIADKVVQNRRKNGTGQDGVKIEYFGPVALSYLSEGNYKEAISIYETLDRLTPNDASVLNNLGFCLIPMDPARAVLMLEKSIRVSGKTSPMTGANLMFALYSVGRHKDALEVAGQIERFTDDAAILWMRDKDGSLVLTQQAVIANYVENILTHIRVDDLDMKGPTIE